MDPIFLTGLVGALFLVAGAAYPVKSVSHPAASVKNWLFAIGSSCLLGYSLLNYSAGGTIFFVILQLFVASASVLMMLNTKDSFDVPFIVVMALAMIGWSLTLFEGYNTLFFIVGLSTVGLGYALEMATIKRNAALAIGSVLIALFSFIDGDMIFFWLNVFFALFSGYYTFKLINAKKAM